MADVPLIFNLFPRHYRYVDDWASAVPHVAEMGFNMIFINPFHATGFSGSLYAVQDYYKLNPYFLKKGQEPADWTPLKKFIAVCKEHGAMPVMDLVINHTAADSVLAKQHPLWYRHDADGRISNPCAVDVDDPGKVTVWGDLGEIDNANSSDRANLWKYWENLVAYFQKMGFKGFRCDAAYKVPHDLWKMLIAAAKKRDANAIFLAETLGCKLEEVYALKGAGFDYLFNSSKYWNYDKSWCLDQHEGNQHVAPSISFPESHDTTRQPSEPPGHYEMQKSKYVLASIFSKGVMMVSGYEYGAKIKTDVVHGSPTDVELHHWDLTRWIASVNALKKQFAPLGEEGHWRAVTTYDADIIFLEKESDNGKKKMLVLVNKDWYCMRTVKRDEFPGEMRDYSGMIVPFESADTKRIPDSIVLKPTEIVLFA
jgi:starch synthase (maltosyl-transferring)